MSDRTILRWLEHLARGQLNFAPGLLAERPTHVRSMASLLETIQSRWAAEREQTTLETASNIVTAATALERELKIFSVLGDGVVLLDHEGKVVRANLAFLNLCGRTEDQVVGSSFATLVDNAERFRQEMLPELLQSGSTRDLLLDLVHRDGTLIEASLTASTVKDFSGEIDEVVIVARDLREFRRRMAAEILADSEHKKAAALQEAEEKLRKLNAELEHRVAERTAELEAFSYSVSHDLRTPLRAIDGFSRVLQEDHAEKLDSECRRLLDVIRRNAERMGTLIDDLLALCGIGRGELNLTEIPMSELAREAFEELEPAVPERTLELDIKALPAAYGDRSMMRQVFVNLLSNAIKFTRPKSSPRIEIGHEQKDGEEVYYVRDNGVGFDGQYGHKLFGVFERLHPATEFEGTGVGLAIVHRIIQRHGGRVWAEGQPNRGASVFFTIPRNTASKR